MSIKIQSLIFAFLRILEHFRKMLLIVSQKNGLIDHLFSFTSRCSHLKTEYEVSRKNCNTFRCFARERTLPDMLANIKPLIFIRSKTSKPNQYFLKWPEIVEHDVSERRLAKQHKKKAQLFPCGKQLRKLNVDKILSKVIGNY
jgi:hypothetical protein